MFLIRFIIYSLISFIIMCLPVQNKPLFDHVYGVVSPITAGVFKEVHTRVKLTSNEVKSIWRAPASSSDSKVRAAMPQKFGSEYALEREDDSYTLEEREILERVMREYHGKK